MENEKNKCIYNHMQYLKLRVNELETINYDEIIDSIEIKRDAAGLVFNEILFQERKYKLKFLLKSLLTLGLYYKKNKLEYLLKKDQFDIDLDLVEERYTDCEMLLLLKNLEKERDEYLLKDSKKYLKQIDTYMSYVNKYEKN